MSNLVRRIIMAMISIPVILWLCLSGGWFFFIFVVIVSAFGLGEFYALAKKKGSHPNRLVGMLMGIAVNASFFTSGHFYSFFDQTQDVFWLTPVIVLGTVLAGMFELFRNKGSAIQNLSSTMFGVMYVSLLFGTLIGIREAFSDLEYEQGGKLVVAILISVWCCDTAAFQIGKKYGRHKLFPRISPNKSWEGATAGFLFAMVGFSGAWLAFDRFLPFGTVMILGLMVGIIGQTGDLMESLLKRDAGVKDSSRLIPGHGGVLDRFDSLLLVSPIVYLYLMIVLK